MPIGQFHICVRPVIASDFASYNRVAPFLQSRGALCSRLEGDAAPRAEHTGRGVFVPLAFVAGTAFQFDWSEDWAVIAGERTKLQVAYFKLSYSRAFFLRAYPQNAKTLPTLTLP